MPIWIRRAAITNLSGSMVRKIRLLDKSIDYLFLSSCMEKLAVEENASYFSDEMDF